MIRCPRCNGRKRMYKVRSIYSHTNSGGVEVDCPLCLGVGKVKPLDQAINDAHDKIKKSKKKKKIETQNAQEESNNE